MESKDCIFCNIAQGKSPAQIEYKDDQIVVFWDIQPHAPVHLLIVSKKHIQTLHEAGPEDAELLGKMLLVAREIAMRIRLENEGYRIVINAGKNAHQVVDHLHIHLLAGADLGEMTSAKGNPLSQYG